MAMGNRFIRVTSSDKCSDNILPIDLIENVNVNKMYHILTIKVKQNAELNIKYKNKEQLLSQYNHILKQLGLKEVDEDFNDKITTPLSQGECTINRDRERIRPRPKPETLCSKYL